MLALLNKGNCVTNVPTRVMQPYYTCASAIYLLQRLHLQRGCSRGKGGQESSQEAILCLSLLIHHRQLLHVVHVISD